MAYSLPSCITALHDGAEVSGFLRDNQGNGLIGITVNASIFSFSNGFTQPFTTTDASGTSALWTTRLVDG